MESVKVSLGSLAFQTVSGWVGSLHLKTESFPSSPGVSQEGATAGESKEASPFRRLSYEDSYQVVPDGRNVGGTSFWMPLTA